MSHVRIVTDSTADIPAALRESLGIAMVPLKVHIGGETYLDAVTIAPEQFYDKLKSAQAMPTTSQPSPVDFVETFRQVAEQNPGSPIVCICLSSALSGTYQAALLARSMLEEQVDVTVIDSRSASYGIGVLAVKAAEAANEGGSRDDIVQLVTRLREKLVLYFLVDTLDYLHKGGRIGKAAALFGTLLSIKPILSIDTEGTVTSVDKVRGQKKALARIIELFKEQDYAAAGQVEFVIAHSQAPELAEEVGALLREHFQIHSFTLTSLGPVIGTHAGPGALGIFMLPA